MPIRRYVDGTEYRAWLIGCDAPGVEKDVNDLKICLEDTLALGYRARVERPIAEGAGTVTRAQIEEALDAMERFEGHRIIWFGGHGDQRDEGRFFRTQGRRSDHVPLPWLYDRLDQLARAGSAPLWAVMDFCHAAPKAREWSEKLVLFCAAHGDEAARGTEAEGGRFTQAVLRGLTAAQPNEAGQVTVDALRTWVNAVVSSGHQHPFFVQGHYGTRVLNHVGPQTPSGTGAERSGDPLGPATQNAIVDALVGAKLAPRAKRTLLFNGLPDAYQYGVPDGPDPISQLRNDVKYLAEAEPVDGQDEPPLALYLANACELARPGRKYRDALVDHRERVLRAPPTTESPDDTPATPAMTLIELRSALCAAYPTVDDVRRLCADAGLKVHRISLQGSVQNIWADALREADLVNQLEALRALARKEYPGRF